MKMHLLLLAAPVLLIAGCDTRGDDVDSKATEAATGTVDVAKEEEAIREQIARWLDLIKAGDAAAIAQMYTEDGAFMPANAPIGIGRETIEQNWAGLMGIPGFDLSFAPEQITVSSSGDMALDRGTYRLATAPDGKEVVEIGKYVVVWRKVDGEWRAAADIINSDAPAGGA